MENYIPADLLEPTDNKVYYDLNSKMYIVEKASDTVANRLYINNFEAHLAKYTKEQYPDHTTEEGYMDFDGVYMAGKYYFMTEDTQLSNEKWLDSETYPHFELVSKIAKNVYVPGAYYIKTTSSTGDEI